jgi:hypothetical protein
MKRNWLQRVAVIAVSVLLAVSVAYAGREHGKESDEALALAKTKINLTQAIAAAEQHLHGSSRRQLRKGCQGQRPRLKDPKRSGRSRRQARGTRAGIRKG